TLRSDLIVHDLLACLDDKVGKGRYILGLTSDHGICPLPEVTKQSGKAADRMVPLGLLSAAEQNLRNALGVPDDDGSFWIEAANEGGIYLNHRAIAAHKRKLEDVAAILAKWLSERPGLQSAYTQEQLLGEIPADDTIGQRVKKSFLADRS